MSLPTKSNFQSLNGDDASVPHYSGAKIKEVGLVDEELKAVPERERTIRIEKLKKQRRALDDAEKYAKKTKENPEASKAYYYGLLNVGRASVGLEVLFAVFAVYAGMIGIELIVAAFQSNKLLVDNADYDEFHAQNPLVHTVAMIVSGVFALFDLVNNGLMVTPKKDAIETAKTKIPVSLKESLVQSQAADEEDGLTAEELTETLNNAKGVQAAASADDELPWYFTTLTYLFACYSSYVVGAAGDLVPFAAEASESPSFLRGFIVNTQDSLALKCGLSALIVVLGAVYYRLFQQDDIFKGVKLLRSGKVSNPNSKAGTFEAWMQILVITLIRGSGFGFITQEMIGSKHFFNRSSSAAMTASFWIGTFVGGLNTFTSRFARSLSAYAGDENEFHVPNQASTSGETYKALAAARIRELPLHTRHWAKASSAFGLAFALGAMAMELLGEKQKAGGYALGVVVFTAIFYAKWRQGTAVQLDQTAWTIYHEDEYEKMANACATNIDRVKTKSSDSSINEKSIEDLCNAYDGLREARDEQLARAGSLGSSLPTQIGQENSALYAAAAVINGGAQVSRYLGAMSSMPLLVSWVGNARAAVYFSLAITMITAVSNFVYGNPKTVNGLKANLPSSSEKQEEGTVPTRSAGLFDCCRSRDEANQRLLDEPASSTYGSATEGDNPLTSSTSTDSGSKTPSPRGGNDE